MPTSCGTPELRHRRSADRRSRGRAFLNPRDDCHSRRWPGEFTTGRGSVEVVEMTRTRKPLRTGRFIDISVLLRLRDRRSDPRSRAPCTESRQGVLGVRHAPVDRTSGVEPVRSSTSTSRTPHLGFSRPPTPQSTPSHWGRTCCSHRSCTNPGQPRPLMPLPTRGTSWSPHRQVARTHSKAHVSAAGEDPCLLATQEASTANLTASTHPLWTTSDSGLKMRALYRSQRRSGSLVTTHRHVREGWLSPLGGVNDVAALGIAVVDM